MSAVAELQVSFDAEGFMTDPNEWTEDIAATLAQEEGIDELTDRHWAVINFVRSEYESTGKPPSLRTITKKGLMSFMADQGLTLKDVTR